MNNFISSLIRTYVPVSVASLISYFTVKSGFLVPDDIANQLVGFLTLFLTALWYTAARFLEVKVNPQFGWLLGLAKQPGYSVEAPPTPAPVESPVTTSDLA